jgi:guanosine-3',5'-bis(diphosphate) 3'-pyrophosphohydrolase
MSSDGANPVVADDLQRTYRPLLEAVAFAARAHRHQLRKDGETPYASHVFRVCLVVRHVFGIDDMPTLITGVLHDTVEDTTTDHDDIAERFGTEIADWVAALSKDKRMAEQEREAAYCGQLQRAPWQVKVCKLGDIFDNMMDPIKNRPEQRGRTLRHARRYLNALKVDLPEAARRPHEIVTQLLETLETEKTA